MDAWRRLDLGDRVLRSRNESDFLGRRKSRTRLQRREPAWRQSLQQFRRCVGCGYGNAEVALPVLAGGRVRLGRRADSSTGRYFVERQPAQSDAVGEPQRILLRARSKNWGVSAGHAPRQTELECGLR